MALSEDDRGRVAQRRRTREAIVSAAAGLLEGGRAPSVNEVAKAADMSRRTIYQYFPNLEQLLLDAALARLAQTPVDEAIDAADRAGPDAGAVDGARGERPRVDGGAGAEERVARMVRALANMSTETLALGRSLIRLTVDGSPEAPGAPLRGYRRVAWIERAVEPLRAELDEATFERLVSALAMVVGWEALIVLQDVRGLEKEERLETSLWAARALVRAALEDVS
ncbi:TetR/AcrR family transcriptional regulator [Pedococcus sp. 5OH_020]|uniref:TetR/AcrR family transcriptional regulator n=1 Tax=Pedococcus sp. 5OH_020 TaxID=2989814 RepID=UPI0022E9F065|nr:TetR family transcriptional regulator [Pedococcus sp. 5OH_020]